MSRLSSCSIQHQKQILRPANLQDEHQHEALWEQKNKNRAFDVGVHYRSVYYLASELESRKALAVAAKKCLDAEFDSSVKVILLGLFDLPQVKKYKEWQSTKGGKKYEEWALD